MHTANGPCVHGGYSKAYPAGPRPGCFISHLCHLTFLFLIHKEAMTAADLCYELLPDMKAPTQCKARLVTVKTGRNSNRMTSHGQLVRHNTETDSQNDMQKILHQPPSGWTCTTV